jgi:hypothetical protein
LAVIRATTECLRPPAPATTTGSPTFAQRLHQAETGLLIIGEHRTRHRAPIREVKPDRLRLGDEVADGEHDAVADQHAIARPLGPERLGGEGV